MCGIAGCRDLSGSERARPWARELMGHRGPDGEGQLEDERLSVSLEHVRLAIIDPDNREADQPFSDPSGRWAIAYNGEIFNYRELRAGLEQRGVKFRTRSDTEVVLWSHILDGAAALERMRGMFAFVVLDRESGEVFAARDQLGVKPLYWSLVDGLFVCASELRTMIGHPHLNAELDPAGVVEFLAFGHNHGERTIVKDVNKLLPGHAFRLTDNGIELLEYWDVHPPAAELNGSDPVAGLRAELEKAVEASLVSDVPVSMMLSGGLDSSTIAVLAARAGPSDLTAYSVSFGMPDDESSVAARLAGDLGMRHREILLTEDRIAASFDDWLSDMDVPSANPTWIAVSHIAEAVASDGGKVLLSGDGGDELLGGYSRWMTYLRFHDRVWRRLPQPALRLSGRAARPLARGLGGDIARRAQDGGELFVGSRPFHDDDLEDCLGQVGTATATAAPPEQALDDLRSRFDERAGDPSDYLSWMSYVALKGHLVEDYLTRLDRMGMAHSVEGRVPLLDPELVRWSFGVSQSQKVPAFRQKDLMRRAVAPMLPDYILDRPKQGFCPPVAEWATALLEDRPVSPALVETGIVAPDALETLRRKGTTNSSFASWALGTLSAWCDANL